LKNNNCDDIGFRYPVLKSEREVEGGEKERIAAARKYIREQKKKRDKKGERTSREREYKKGVRV
jgi:hypothetical protein